MNNNRNLLLDNLKGVCILFVVITHFSWTDGERLHFLFPFWIDMAVPIFMIISGYVYTKSFIRKKIHSLIEAYSFEYLVGKTIKYTLPYLIVFIPQVFYGEMLLNKPIGWGGVFLQGGLGPGSYYYPVMLQFILIFPLIYCIIEKSGGIGLIVCFFINAVYEILKTVYGMNESCYRLLIFRYIFVIAYGCFMAKDKYRLKKLASVSLGTVGLVYIYLVCYTDYYPKYIIYWTRTSFLAVLYVIPIFTMLFNKFKNISCKGISYLGKISYDIFLIQMLYYTCLDNKISIYVGNRGVHLTINIIICTIGGVIFHLVETKASKRIENIIFNKWKENKMEILNGLEKVLFINNEEN